MGLQEYFRKRKSESITLSEVEVEWLGIRGKWVADRAQQQAAWELYVELVTRIATEPLGPAQGLLREALSSLHALFAETRRILKEYGPRVAIPTSKGTLSLAEIALVVLNRHLRPLLAEWHTRLQSYELERGQKVSIAEHERAWEHSETLRRDLEKTRKILTLYAGLLARACGTRPLHSVSEDAPKSGS